TARLPVRTLLIANNTIEFDLESAATAPFSGASEMGIGFWDATNSTAAFNVRIAGNIIVNAPASGIRWASGGGDNIEISANSIINAGSAANPGLPSAFRSAVMFTPGKETTHSVIVNNNIVDNAPNGRMAYGIEIGEHACVVADGNIVSANAAANGSYQNYIITRQGTCRSYVRGL